MLSAFNMIVRFAWDLLQWCGLMFRPHESLEAEILFLRRQLALYRERGVKPRRVDAAIKRRTDVVGIFLNDASITPGRRTVA